MPLFNPNITCHHGINRAMHPCKFCDSGTRDATRDLQERMTELEKRVLQLERGESNRERTGR